MNGWSVESSRKRQPINHGIVRKGARFRVALEEMEMLGDDRDIR